jgi:hypothetical protein
MEVDTKAHRCPNSLDHLQERSVSAHKDIEQVPLPIDVKPCKAVSMGTTITLNNLNQNLNYPKATS